MQWTELKKKATQVWRERQLSSEYLKRLKVEFDQIEIQGAAEYWLELYENKTKFDHNSNGLVLPFLLGICDVDPITYRSVPMMADDGKLEEALFFQFVDGQEALLPSRTRIKVGDRIIKADQLMDVDLPNPIRKVQKKAIKVKDVSSNGYETAGLQIVPRIGIPPHWERQPDVPDIDIDYLPEARNKIRQYAMRRFGPSHVCSVGLWQSYKPRLAMQDVARALNFDLKPVMKLTKTLPDDFDDRDKEQVLQELREGATGDLEQLGAYYATEEGKQVVDTAYRMVGMLKTQGKHAGGLIISSTNLFNAIPMSKLGGLWTSQWTEGYSPQLSKFGFIKWDILGLKTLYYIWRCLQLIKENGKDHGLPKCPHCNGEGLNTQEPPPGWGRYCLYCGGDGVDWEAMDYNDPDALRLADELKTDSIFQFDTDLAKSILKKGGVKSLDDLIIYSSLGRPGPLPLVDEYIKRREDKEQNWKKNEHPRVVKMFEKTYGIVCIAEGSLISMANGLDMPIEKLKKGDKIASFSTDDKKIEVDVIEEIGPTRFGEGLEINLENGYQLTTTADHQIFTVDGYRRADSLREGDLVAVPARLPSSSQAGIGRWLGSDEAIAYFLGLLVGDGCITSTSLAICPGSEDHADTLIKWLKVQFPKLKTRKYHSCRAWYIAFSCGEKEESSICLPPYEDTYDWWSNAYSKYTYKEISGHLNRSIWFVHRRLKKHNVPLGIRRPHKRTKLHQWLDLMFPHKHCLSKRIPLPIMMGNSRIKYAFIAGMIDSDGYINKRGYGGISSANTLLLQDFRRLLLSVGIMTKLGHQYLLIAESQRLKKNVSDFLILKRFDKCQHDALNVGWMPRRELKMAVGSETQRCFAKRTGISRRTINYPGPMRTSTAAKIGLKIHQLRFLKVKSINKVKDTQFYGMAVKKNHNFIANHICVKNCFQEQLQHFWVEICGFTIPEAEAARKAVAKKWADKMAKVMEKAEHGASKTIGIEEAKKWNERIATFGRYAFNLSHVTSYIIISYRCLYLKAKFPAEWWAAVLSECHNDKVPKFIAIARQEGVAFGALHCDQLSENYTVRDDVIIPGLVSIKGIGPKTVAGMLQNRERNVKYESLDHFIELNGKNKTVMERLIKLGAFDHLYPDRAVLWGWYLWKYVKKGPFVTAMKEKYAWTEEQIQEERDRRAKEFRRFELKRVADYEEAHGRRIKPRKVPAKILNWKHKVELSFSDIEKECKGAWSDPAKIVSFEKQYYGFHYVSPMNCFEHNNYIIAEAKDSGIIEGVVQATEIRKTRTGKQFIVITVTDGLGMARITIWDPTQIADVKDVAVGKGIKCEVDYDESFNSFAAKRHTMIIPLARKKRRTLDVDIS